MGDNRRMKANWRGPAGGAGRTARGGFNPEAVSAILRNTRILNGYHDINEVAREIKVRRNYLEAIEDGRYHDLPGVVYAQGFIGAYARFLNLDVEEMVERYKAEAGAPLRGPAVAAPVRRASAAANGRVESRLPNSRIIVGTGLFILLMILGWQMVGQRDRAAVLAVPPLPAALQAPARPAAAPVAVASPMPEVPQAPIPAIANHVWLRALTDAQVQIFSGDGNRLASLQLKMGEIHQLPENAGVLRLVTRMPQNFQVQAGTRRYSLPRAKAAVTELWLDPARLLAPVAR